MTAVEAPYDAEVEYLESTGTQYIDTGLYFDNDSVLDIRAEVRGIGTSNIGLISGGNNSGRALEWYIWIDHAECYVGNFSAQDFLRALSVGDRIDLSVADGLVLCRNLTKGTTVTAQYSYTQRTAFTVSLFALHRSATGYTYRGKYRIYKALIGALDLIPVRFTNDQGLSEGAMYDKVSGQLFRNQGTGAFLYGADVRPYSTPAMGLHFMREPVTARSYAQDGLVAMWDGIENAGWGVHDAAATTWSNLMGGGYDFSLTARGSFGMDSLICAGAGSACGFADRLSSFVSMEAVLRWDTSISGAYQMAFATAFNGKAIMQYFNASRSLLAFNSYYQISLGRDAEYLARRHHISVEYAGTADGAKVVSAVLDGSSVAVVNSTSTGYSVEAGKMFVGGQDTGSAKPFFGEICALRLYSRALTAAEIAANYAIDRERFNLP